MKMDIDTYTDEFKKSLFGGKVNRFLAKIHIQMEPDEVSRFVKLMQLNNLENSVFFSYHAYFPGNEASSVAVGQILTKHIMAELQKSGEKTTVLYASSAAERDQLVQDFTDNWKQVKANMDIVESTVQQSSKTIEF